MLIILLDQHLHGFEDWQEPGLAINGLNYIYKRPLMPCGLGFLNGDFPPSFCLSPFQYGHWFGFQNAVWIPNREVKAVESLPDLPSLSPLLTLVPVPKPQEKKTVLLSGFQREREKPCWDSKKSTGKWLVQEFSSDFAPEPQTHRPCGGDGRGPAQRHGHLSCRGRLKGQGGGPVPAWVKSPPTYFSTSLSPIPSFSEPLNLLEALIVL